LPFGTSWDADLNGATRNSTSATISFSEPNGSYTFEVGSVSGFTATPSSGGITLAGMGAFVHVTFTANNTLTKYSVTFTESGLAKGSLWDVELNGTTHNTTSTTIAFSQPNGSYAFAVGCGSDYTASPPSGYANVTGSSVGVSITCQNATGLFPLTFRTSGLPAGTDWSVTLSATTGGLTIEIDMAVTHGSGGAAEVGFQVSKGTYVYSAAARGFQGASGSVEVPGTAPAYVTVSLVPTSSSLHSGPTVLGLPIWAGAIGIAFVLIGAVGFASTVYRVRQSRK
jgi:hypothetical protein